MVRKQFTFYESFAKAIGRIKSKEDKADAYDAIINYALYGIEPDLDMLPDVSAVAFELSKPNLDASRKKASSGKVGGSNRKQTGSKQEAKRKQDASKPKARDDEADYKQGETASEKEGEIEKEIEIEIENKCCYPPTPLTTETESENAVSAVLADYMSRINPSASQASLDELRGYAEEMGDAVCKRAFDIALDSKKATWPYIRAILRDKQSKGVKCLADWDAFEKKREKQAPQGESEQLNFYIQQLHRERAEKAAGA